MQCLIIGYGSIGKRHAQILKNLGCHISLVTSQMISGFACYLSVEQAMEKNSIDYVVISNQTYLHFKTLINLIHCNYQGVVLVEKPLFSRVEYLPENKFKKILVAYNLRFHELMTHVKSMIKNENIITFSAYVGQYLPTWRKDKDYKDCYSAKKDHGGGVLRDLSHELDYSLYLCGPCQKVTALGGHFSDLDIDSDDAYSIMMKCEFCPLVNLQLNYLDRSSRREITINTQNKTIFIDLVKGSLSVDGETKIQCQDSNMQTYIEQHKAILSSNFESFCSYQDGMRAVKLIETIEKATTTQTWITI